MSLRQRASFAAAMLLLLATALPAPITASDETPPQTDRRPVEMVALGDWYYLESGRIVCESPGTTCLMITLGPLRLVVPVAVPSGTL